MTPNEILTLTDNEFHKLVDDDLRRQSPQQEHRSGLSEETAQALRSPAVVDRWYSMLHRMARQVETQLATRDEQHLSRLANLRRQILEQEQALHDALESPQTVIDAIARQRNTLQIELEKLETTYHDSRAKTLRFASGLDQHLLEAQALRASARDRMYDSVVAEERNHYAARNTDLKARVAELEGAILAHHQGMVRDNEPTELDVALWAYVGLGHVSTRKAS